MAQDPWDSAKPVDNPDEAPPGAEPVQAAPMQFPGDDLLKGPPPIPEVDLNKPVVGGLAPPGSEGPAYKAGMGALRFGTEVGAELLGSKVMAPVKGASKLVALGRRAFGAGVGGAAASASNDVANLAGGPPPTIDEIGRRAVTTGVQGAAGEGVAAGISKAWSATKAALGGTRLGRPFAHKMTDDGRLATATLNDHVTPAQVNDSQTLRILENVMSGSLFGSGRYRKFLTEQEELLHGKADELVNAFGPTVTREQAGKSVLDRLEMAHDAAKTSASRLYDDVDTLSEGVTVPLDSLRSFVEEEATRRGKLGMALAPGKVKSTGGAVMRASEVADDVAGPVTQGDHAAVAALGGMAEGPEKAAFLQVLQDAKVAPNEAGDIPALSFRQAHEVRSALGRQIRVASRSNDPGAKNSVGFLKQLYGRLDDAMTTAAGGADSDLGKAYGTATKAWKTMAETYDQGLLRDVAKKRPDVVVAEIIRPGRVEEINTARKVLGDATWKQVQRVQAEQLLVGRGGKDLVGGAELVDRMQRMKPETLKAVFPNGQDQALWVLARTMKQIQGKGPGGMKMWIQLAQGGAVGAVLTGAISPQTGAIILTPLMISRAMLHPTARQWLTTGLKATPKGEDPSFKTRAASQLASWFVKEGLLDAADTGASVRGGPPVATVPPPSVSGRGAGPGPRAGAPPPAGLDGPPPAPLQ